MRIGQMDRQITLQTATEVNTDGSLSLTWATLASVWAHVTQERGTERHDADQVLAERHTTFRIRWRDDVTETMRVLYGDNTFDVSAVIELGRREGLELITTAAVPA